MNPKERNGDLYRLAVFFFGFFFSFFGLSPRPMPQVCHEAGCSPRRHLQVSAALPNESGRRGKFWVRQPINSGSGTCFISLMCLTPN
jgi:hypothetical protein